MNSFFGQLLLLIPGQVENTPLPLGGTGDIEVRSVWDFVVKGGVLMVPLGLCSLLALGVIVERLVSLRRAVVIPVRFVSEMRSALQGGNERVGLLLECCKRHPSPIANIVAAGVRHGRGPAELIEKRIDEAGIREAVSLRNYLRALGVVASVAPLLGLLGTIFGMIRAFQTVALAGEALGKTELLARGIYEAMITTAAGLVIAIPALVCYHWLSARVDRLVLEMDRLAVELIEGCSLPGWIIASRGGGGSWAPDHRSTVDDLVAVQTGLETGEAQEVAVPAA